MKPNTYGLAVMPGKQETDSLYIRFPNVHFSSSVHDLGFFLDPVLSLSDHVNSVTRSCFCYLRQLLLSRQSLPLHAITILVHTLICTRVDYGNAVYIGLSSTNASKLQSVLTAAAHLIGASQSSPVSFLSPETPFTGFLFTSTSNSRSTTS